MADIIDRLTPVLLVVAVMATPVDACAQTDESEVTVSGAQNQDIFASAKQVTVQADVNGGVIVMGGKVDIRSRITGDVVSMGGNLSVGDDVAGDVIAAGGNVDVRGRVGGDVTGTGGKVDVDAAIAGDALIMGGRARIGGEIKGDLKTTAGDAVVDAVVGGNLMLAGGHTTVDFGADIAGNVWIFGARVNINGLVGKNVRAAGRHVTIAGEIAGNVHIDALEITVLPTASISGNFSYRSPYEADIREGARIAGDVTFTQSEDPRHVLGRAFAAAGGFVFALIGGLLVLGAEQVLALPGLSLAATGRTSGEPWKAAGVGFAIVIATPIATMLLMSTIVGILLGLVIGAAYLVLLALGIMIAAVVVGRWSVRRLGRDWDDRALGRVAMVVIGLLAIAVVCLIPFLVGLFALALGVGGLVLQTLRREASKPT